MKAQAAFTNGREQHMDLQVTCILFAIFWLACAALFHLIQRMRDIFVFPGRCCGGSSLRVPWRVPCSSWRPTRPGRGAAGLW